MVHSLCGAVPTCVVCVPGVRACIDLVLLDLADPLILQALLNLEKSLSMLFILWVSNNSNGGVPGWLLGSKEVSIDFTADDITNFFNFLIVGVNVLIPSIETVLISLIVELTVSNTSNSHL